MRIRTLNKEEVVFSIEVDFDDLPIRNNAMVSDNPEDDKKYEDKLIARVAFGDVWAWAHVTVRATWKSFSGRDDLGGCSYANQEEFINDSYYEGMCHIALLDLQKNIESTARDIAELTLLKKQ